MRERKETRRLLGQKEKLSSVRASVVLTRGSESAPTDSVVVDG